MHKWITKQQILGLVYDKNFKNEDEFRDYLAPKLVKLFKVKEDQIEIEPITTSFDNTLSNLADIIIRNENKEFKKALVVIELKLSKSIDQFKNGDYGEAGKQLKKYCQDTRAPYGILLTEDFCAIFRNKYFSYDQEPKRVEENKIPSIKEIKNILAKESLIDFFFLNESMKYVLLLATSFLIFSNISASITKIYGFLASFILSLLICSIIGVTIAIIFNIRKTLD